MTTAIADVLARVETIRPGDQVRLPVLGLRTVADVLNFDDDTLVIVYEDDHANSWENRAQDKGRWHVERKTGPYFKSLRPLRVGERWRVRRAS